MSDLAATNCGGGCGCGDNNNNSCIWLILIVAARTIAVSGLSSYFSAVVATEMAAAS